MTDSSIVWQAELGGGRGRGQDMWWDGMTGSLGLSRRLNGEQVVWWVWQLRCLSVWMDECDESGCFSGWMGGRLSGKMVWSAVWLPHDFLGNGLCGQVGNLVVRQAEWATGCGTRLTARSSRQVGLLCGDMAVPSAGGGGGHCSNTQWESDSVGRCVFWWRGRVSHVDESGLVFLYSSFSWGCNSIVKIIRHSLKRKCIKKEKSNTNDNQEKKSLRVFVCVSLTSSHLLCDRPV